MNEQNKATNLPPSFFYKFIAFFAILTLLVSLGVNLLLLAITPKNHINTAFSSSTIETAGIKTVTEESAVMTAVKHANAGVVSIIISQNVTAVNSFNSFNNSSNKSQEVGAGSGFIISKDGLIMTNKHVVENANSSYSVLLSTGKKYNGVIIYKDPVNDIAFIKINAANLPVLYLSTSSNLQLGQLTIAIGNALGQYQNTVSVGIISGMNRTVNVTDQSGNAGEKLKNLLQTNAQINPGNSGGPLLNIDGEVIGINTAIAQNAQAIGFAIPIDQAKASILAAEKAGKIVP